MKIRSREEDEGVEESRAQLTQPLLNIMLGLEGLRLCAGHISRGDLLGSRC